MINDELEEKNYEYFYIKLNQFENSCKKYPPPPPKKNNIQKYIFVVFNETWSRERLLPVKSGLVLSQMDQLLPIWSHA